MAEETVAAGPARGLRSSLQAADTSEEVLDTTVGGVLRAAAAAWPEREALVAGLPDPAARRRWTYAQLLADAERCARALLARFEPGEHVAAWAPNLAEWVVLEYGAALAGLVLVTVNPAYRPNELAYVLRQSKAAAIVLTPEFRSPMLAYLEEVRPELPLLREVILFTEWEEFLASADAAATLPDVRPEQAVQIQYTSGTTGFPKGAMLHHRGATNNARLYARRISMGPGDVYVNPMPLFHTAGCMMGVLGCCQAGARLVPVVAFEPGLVLELLETERGTAMCGVPTMLVALLEHPDRPRRDLSSIRVAVSGGSLVPEPLARRVEAELGVPMCIVFGTTECSPLISLVAPEDEEQDRVGTLGRPLPQTEVKVADPATGEPVPVGETGELCCRGYSVMLGYHDMPEATAEAIDADGWYHTGDLASMDERGYLRVEGRIKDMIIRGGENIYPREIEERLAAHPGVGDVAVVGVPHDIWGEIVAAVIRPAADPPPSAEELRAWCRESLAPYKTPAVWRFVDSLPLTASGKVQKYVLRARLAEEPPADL